MKSSPPKLGPRFSAALDEHPVGGETAAAGAWADALLHDALDAHASDIHLDPRPDEFVLRFRIDGALHDLDPLELAIGERLIRYFRANSEMHTATHLGPEDAHFEFESDRGSVDVRVACAPCVAGEKMTLRLLPRARIYLGLHELGFSDSDLERIHGWLDEVTGMFLVTGPTGSGKTTTLHAILREMALAGSCVITIEDPVEYHADGVNQIEVDELKGITFASGLRTALRLDPDQILLGEIRDELSAQSAVRAAGTGHTILASMHSRSVTGAISMLRNFGLTHHEIAISLAFVVCQRLVRALCPDCKHQVPPCERDQRWLRRMGVPVPAKTWMATGCEACGGSGFAGRTGVFEIWPFDEMSYDLVLKGEDEHTLRKHLRTSGMHPLFQDALEKATQGIIPISELRGLGVLNPS